MFVNKYCLFILFVFIGCESSDSPNKIRFADSLTKKSITNYKVRVDVFCMEGTNHINSVGMPEISPNSLGEIFIEDIKKSAKIKKNDICIVFLGDNRFSDYRIFSIKKSTRDTTIFVTPTPKKMPTLW
jgi:hypothetical protein